MARLTAQNVETIPYGPLGIIAMPGCEAFADKVDQYLVQWRKNQALEHQGSIAFYGYQRETYKIDISNPRFGSGEGKAVINETVRGYDLYIVTDCFNYSVTYEMYGMTVPKSPDDHYADLKRVISAASSKAKRISVIMPMLYEGRQHKRASRESLDCAMALQELVSLGVENIITFDAHDQRVQNAIPHKSFENVMPTYQMIKAFVNNIENLNVDKDHLMVISPDEGAMQRCIYFATQLGVNLGMFYKRRDFTRVVNGRNPIVEHQYLGDPLNGKDVIIVDDMISSGESMLEVAKSLRLWVQTEFLYAPHSAFLQTALMCLTKHMKKAYLKKYSQQTAFIKLRSFFQESGINLLIFQNMLLTSLILLIMICLFHHCLIPLIKSIRF